ncbi:MAG: hypothetical protein IJP73_06685 [Bacteroidales bacterium]|nr:hypothetical protein [Bacteroidales bacterium]
MKKQNEQILNYEAPEVEVMDFRLEANFVATGVCSAYNEPLNPEICGCDEASGGDND